MPHVKIQHVLYVKTLILKEIEILKKKFRKKGLGEKEKSISKMKKNHNLLFKNLHKHKIEPGFQDKSTKKPKPRL